MRKAVTGAFVSLDGVMPAPGGPDEDPTHGFKLGGWVEVSSTWTRSSVRQSLRCLTNRSNHCWTQDPRDLRGALAVRLRRRRRLHREAFAEQRHNPLPSAAESFRRAIRFTHWCVQQ